MFQWCLERCSSRSAIGDGDGSVQFSEKSRACACALIDNGAINVSVITLRNVIRPHRRQQTFLRTVSRSTYLILLLSNIRDARPYIHPHSFGLTVDITLRIVLPPICACSQVTRYNINLQGPQVHSTRVGITQHAEAGEDVLG